PNTFFAMEGVWKRHHELEPRWGRLMIRRGGDEARSERGRRRGTCRAWPNRRFTLFERTALMLLRSRRFAPQLNEPLRLQMLRGIGVHEVAVTSPTGFLRLHDFSRLARQARKLRFAQHATLFEDGALFGSKCVRFTRPRGLVVRVFARREL